MASRKWPRRQHEQHRATAVGRASNRDGAPMSTPIAPDFDDRLALDTEALPLVEPTAGKFSQEQALDWLSTNANSAKPVREIAQIWGWHRSRVQRFLSRFRETSGETKALSRETSGETSE